jgi:hypothetical protein
MNDIFNFITVEFKRVSIYFKFLTSTPHPKEREAG